MKQMIYGFSVAALIIFLIVTVGGGMAGQDDTGFYNVYYTVTSQYDDVENLKSGDVIYIDYGYGDPHRATVVNNYPKTKHLSLNFYPFNDKLFTYAEIKLSKRNDPNAARIK
jgi:hypothetical protein